MKITKAIIPAAGLGTRFLPYTKSVPKELLPIMQTPALQFIIEEGLLSGIKEFEIIANQNKHAIHEYFSKNSELEDHLTKTHKIDLLASLNTIIEQAQFNYIQQPEPLGLGHAVLMAESTIDRDEYFSILLPDEIMFGSPALMQLITIAKTYKCSVIAVQEIPQAHVSSYGIIAIQEQLSDNLFVLNNLVEKPTPETAPSNFAIIGRYILSSSLFSSLKNIKPGVGNEIQLTDGIIDMMQRGEKVLAYKINTVRHDIGNPIGWLQANMYYALSQPTSSLSIKNYLNNLQ